MYGLAYPWSLLGAVYGYIYKIKMSKNYLITVTSHGTQTQDKPPDHPQPRLLLTFWLYKLHSSVVPPIITCCWCCTCIFVCTFCAQVNQTVTPAHWPRKLEVNWQVCVAGRLPLSCLLGKYKPAASCWLTQFSTRTWCGGINYIGWKMRTAFLRPTCTFLRWWPVAAVVNITASEEEVRSTAKSVRGEIGCSCAVWNQTSVSPCSVEQDATRRPIQLFCCEDVLISR